MGENTSIESFFTDNLDKILSIGKTAYGKIDASIQVNLKSAYTKYLTKTRLKYSKSKSFFIRDQPVELYSYYVPTGITCGKKTFKKPSFKECTEFTKHIIIAGTGGSGKSVLIKHLFLDCIQEKEFAPILIELRDLNTYEKTLNDFINETLELFDFKIKDPFVKYAKEAGHFCFFLDGLDEITPKLRKKVIKDISSLSKQYPKCPIFLSSRPDDVLSGLDDFSTFKMMPLELEEALILVAKLPFEEVIKTKFSEDLSNGLFEKHQSFLSNPLLLSIMLLTYGENAEIPSKLSIFYNQAYEALFNRHDANKGGYRRKRLTNLDIQDFGKVFSLFCLLTYDKRLFKMSRTQCLDFINKSIDSLGFKTSSEDYLNDLLSAACLMIEDGLEIAFSHRSFQEYFVALQISNSVSEIQNMLLERYLKNIKYDNVIFLLQEINPELVERSLLVPNMDVLLNKIGVKRMVGITHYVRYMKYFHTAIVFHNDRITGHVNEVNYVTLKLLHMMMNYSEYAASISEDENKWRANYEQYRLELYAEFGKKDKSVDYKTKTLTIRSPLIIRLSQGYGAFSLTYLKSVFNTYKMLKSKHANSVQNFDALLGIK